MLEETLALWQSPKGIHYVDGTVGNGGHAAALLSRVPEARLLGIDRDGAALERARARLQPFGERAVLCQGSFAQLNVHLRTAGFPAQVDGILLDLGLGSHQLDSADRGFSFRFDGPLDMRFDQSDETRLTAAALLAQSSEAQLVQIFRDWGEEPQARRAARAIVQWPEPLVRTNDLTACLRTVFRPSSHKRRNARASDGLVRCFQAIRIAVNEELQQLDQFLQGAVEWTAPGGRLVFISFHSLEDRRVKQHLRALAKGCICPPDLPVCGCGQVPTMRLLHRRAIQASAFEIEANPRARSARLRAAEKITSPLSSRASH